MPKIREPRYHKVAQEIAQDIVDNHFLVGQKLHARSTLAATYGVSAETARKAVSVLADLAIVKPVHGSGVEVLSRGKAQDFLSQASASNNIQATNREIKEILKRQKEDLTSLNQLLGLLADQTQQVRQQSPMAPHEFIPDDDSQKLHQSIGTLNIWQNTGATVVAILHQDELVLSPGPYAVIEPGDTVYFVGPDKSVLAMQQFFAN
ncbi:GntR family transcriptional regulator [Eupransor demetentiae]|uniref:GntR family (MngR) n=1 Tax=Eupransor demetentiae TaxID=3109584 RepID=A0ABM9N2U5_9LACO|nr:DNA-binding transcriptional regulator [Lactobacillaceae bacterium LMG 33000]